MTETFNLNDKDHEIYQEFVIQHDLKNPDLIGDAQEATMTFSFDQEGIPEPAEIYKEALLHFDMSVIDLHYKVVDKRIYLTFEF